MIYVQLLRRSCDWLVALSPSLHPTDLYIYLCPQSSIFSQLDTVQVNEWHQSVVVVLACLEYIGFRVVAINETIVSKPCPKSLSVHRRKSKHPISSCLPSMCLNNL